LQVESFFRAHARVAVFILALGTLLVVIPGCVLCGCHRAPGADVVATVNGKEIMRADLEKLYRANLGDSQQQQQLDTDEADMKRLNVLDGMIEDEILQQRAAKLNLAASDEDVNAKVTEMKALSTEEEWENQLKQRGLTLEDLKRNIRRSLTQTKVVNKEIDSKINITDAEITGYYNSHKSEYNLIEPQYRLAQIVVTGAPPQQGAMQSARKGGTEAEARKEIESIRTRIASGEDFGTLASEFSENAQYRPNGGDMGFVTETQLKGDSEVYNAVSKLRPGQVTEPLTVYDGPGPNHKVVAFALYKLLGREAAGQRELNDPRVQQSIRQGLRERKSQLLKTAYFEMLHNNATVHNYFAEEVLKKGAQ